MALNCGVVGLPNVGKSTLFNALTSSANAEAANYPFCTIEPNLGKVVVPDTRLDQLALVAGSAKIIPTTLEFVDIAGLVKGASQGQGLGNQFLDHIRKVDSILHVVRCFDSEEIIHVEGKTDPLRDIDIINMELLFSDIDGVAKRMKKLKDPMLEKLYKDLHDGKAARSLPYVNDDKIRELNLLTAKPVTYVANVMEEDLKNGNKHSEQVARLARKCGAEFLMLSANLEMEMSTLGESKAEMLACMDLQESGLDALIKLTYKQLHLQTFFTLGPKEAKAWTITKGTLAPAAAGKIHSDLERGFISARIISWQDYLEVGGEANAKAQGKIRSEGKDYVMQDGDVAHFLFNV